MTDDDEQPFRSTTWEWRHVKVGRSAGGSKAARRSRSFRRLSVWPRTRPMRITLTYKAGAQSWWLVEARGTSCVVPGDICLEDLMAIVLNER